MPTTIASVTGFAFMAPTDHGVLRNSLIHDSGLERGANTSAISFSGTDAANRNDSMLVYNVTVRDLGSWTSDLAADIHAIKPRYFCRRIWILNNTLYHVQGDSVQTGEASGADFPQYVYIGGNTMYENKENCVDIKDGDDIIISGNTCYGMNTLHGDDEGAGIVIHEDADNTWVINNLVYNCTVGLINTQGTNIYFVGNVIRDIDGSASATDHYGAGVAVHLRGTGGGWVVNNTIHNADKAIQFTGASGTGRGQQPDLRPLGRRGLRRDGDGHGGHRCRLHADRRGGTDLLGEHLLCGRSRLERGDVRMRALPGLGRSLVHR